MNTFRTLSTVNTQINETVNVTGQPLTPYDSAIEVMTSVAKIKPLLVNPDTSIDDAITLVKTMPNLHYLIIGDDKGVLGVLKKKVLIGRNVLMIATRRGIQRSDLNVSDLMDAIETLPTLFLSTVEQSRIGDVKQTIENLHDSIFAVVNNNGGFSGLIFSSDIEYALQERLHVLPMVHSFKDCFEIIHEGIELI